LSAHLVALRLLASRELTEAQLRERLARRGFDDASIDESVARLLANGSLSDERAARAMARTEAIGRGRGRLRVVRKLESAGIASAVARRAVDDVFQDIDPEAALRKALDRRLRGKTTIADDRERQRLYRYLIGQGFESDRVAAALRALPRD
jgi:regulatory protein